MRLQKRSTSIALLVVSALLLPVHSIRLLAQGVTAAIHGTITDNSGAIVGGAAVEILNTSTGITVKAKTDSKGYFIVTQLAPGGPYSVTVTANGFQSFVANDVNLVANDNRDVDAKLQVGSSSTTVQVSATALQVETSDTQLKQVVTSDQLEGIPLEGRDAAGLQKLQPGVVESSDRFGSYSNNGNQSSQNSYMLGGADINDGPLQNEGIQINPDALQEEDNVTSTMSPEFARNSGSTISQILKSGTNSIHGSGFEFYRDTFLNNGNYFSQVRPVFHQNLYGATLGGPILKNKFFAFVAYQGLRNRTASTTTANTLDAQQFNGSFTADTNYFTGAANSAGLTTNPIPFAINGCAAGTPWNTCFTKNGATTVNISPAIWNSISSKLINTYVPQPNNGTNLYTFNALSTAAQDQGIVRLDYTPSSKDSIYFTTVVQSSPSADEQSFGGGSFPGFGQHASAHFKVFSASWTHTFSSSILNEVRAGYYRFNFPSVIATNNSSPSALGFAITPQLSAPGSAGIPYLGIGNYFDLGNSFEGPQPRIDSNLTYSDAFSWIRGSHSIKLGGSFEQFRVHNPFGYLNNGDFSFNGGGQYSSGDPLIDFALGIPDTYEQTSNGYIDAVATETYAYAQDNWKVSPDFTFNYGIAWDAEKPNQNRQFNGLGVTCWQNSSSASGIFPGAPPGLSFPGDPGCNSAGGPVTHYNRFGPRIGFAWSPGEGPSQLVGESGSHSLSIRGGFGLYYNRDQEEQSLQNLEDPPFFYTSRGAGDFQTASGLPGSPSFANPFVDIAGNGSEPNPFPFNAPAAGSHINWPVYNQLELATFDRQRYTVPYTYNFNLNIQRSIGRSMVAQIGYVGSLSHRLPSWYEGDPITAAGHAACLTNPACSSSPQLIHPLFPQYTAQPASVPGTTIPWYTSIAEQTTEGASNYNSFQASLIKSPTHGLQFTLAYTYSHSLDDGSGYESITGGDSGYGNSGRVHNYVPGFEHLNYGSSDFDARHRFVASYVYAIPVAGFLAHNFVARETLAGWGVSGVTALQAGFPVAVSEGTQRSLWCDAYSYFGCGDVPDTSSFNIKNYNPRSTPGLNQYFDTSSFSTEPVGTFGNTSRNFFHGPGFNYTNLNLFKNIHLTSDGTKYIQLRLEAFNAFNHANFAAPTNSFLNPTFGRVTSVISSADPNADPQPGRAIQLAGKFYF